MRIPKTEQNLGSVLRIRIHFQVFFYQKCEDFTNLHGERIALQTNPPWRTYSTSNMKFLNCFCMALPRVKFLSNPRRMHSKGEGEEKEEQGLPRAPSCCSTTFPAPSPSPPTHAARLLGCLGPVIRTQVPPPSPIVNRPEFSDFEKKRLKSMTASF
jgi:hypothetical protein